MITFVRALAVLSALGTATPTLAHTARDLPRAARNYEAVGHRMPPQDAARPFSFGVGDDDHQTATGGPVGGLIDKN